MVRALLLVALGLGVGVGLVLVPISVYALVSPYSSAAVPSTCAGEAARATAANQVTVEGLGEGILVAQDGASQVVAVPGPGGSTSGGSAVVLRDGMVIARLPVASRTVDAGIADGIIYLFDDKIGFLLDATTGQPLPRLFESDNYRGLFTADGVEYVQTSIEATAVGLGGRPFMTRTLGFGGVVDGCLLAGPAAG
jgi:hypothetical protein